MRYVNIVRDCRPGFRLGVAAVLLTASLVACAPVGRDMQRGSCSERRLNLASSLYERAREQLAIHFEQRMDSALGEAYQSSQDAVTLARATVGCRDFDPLVRRQAIDLIRTNLLFQKLVVSNMRDQDPGVVVDLYGNQYREIFKNDIQ